jgi:hypothetical protein
LNIAIDASLVAASYFQLKRCGDVPIIHLDILFARPAELGHLQPFSMVMIVTLDRPLRDGDLPAGDLFFKNTTLNVSSYRKHPLTEKYRCF